MNYELKTYPCPVCSSQERTPLYQIKGFSLVRCKSCALEYISPRIANEQVYQIYRDDYFHRPADGYDNYELTESLRRKTFQRWFEQIRPFIKVSAGNALDIGCAAGYFLDILKEHQWQGQGIELDTRMLNQVRDRGLTVSDMPLEFFKADRTFDLITLFDVLEHLPGLNEDIDRLAQLLSPGGIIALVTPDCSSVQRKLFGRHWFQYKPKEHIQYFSRATLSRVMEKHGLRVVYASSCGQYADCSFLYNRLQRYGFPRMAKLFNWVTGLLRLRNAAWYTDTGSLFAIIEKVQASPQ